MQLPPDFLSTLSPQLPDLPSFLAALDEPAPVSVRWNPTKQQPAFPFVEPIPWHPHGYYLQVRPMFTLDPLFQAGCYYVQEASSMFLHHALQQLLDLTKDWKVLDLCAAPGGKSTLVASALSPGSLLVANETINKRVEPLRHNLTKWGNTNVLVSNHDPADFSSLAGFFDVVVVDAPCSGEGLFRKDPDAVKEWSLAQVGHCGARQRRILQEAVQLLVPGGLLVYSTCTYNRMENDDNMAWLCDALGFETVKLDVPDEWGIVKTGLGWQFYPHLAKGEGFYLSILRNTGNFPTPVFKKKPAIGLAKLPQKEVEMVSQWLAGPDRFSFFQKPDNEIVAVPKILEPEFAQIISCLKRRSSGLEIGSIKQKNFVPSHALALSQAVNPDLPGISLTKEQAVSFLKKNENDIGSHPNGWHLVRYEGANLGWLKMIGHRYNNYLPNEWRIRMAGEVGMENIP